jgi:NAD(P)-dependent dehydrogenase (short-subunit alcohol dehydrogenase family)
MTNDQYPSDTFDGRVAVVTGGSSGIGLEVVQYLQAKGAIVTCADLTESDAASHYVPMDVTDSASVDNAIRDVGERYGRLDVLVCCAGIFGEALRTVDVPDSEWRLVLQVNLDGTFFANRAAIPLMAENGYGRIVNIASTAGKEGNPRAAAYSAAKAGVMALTQAIGRDVAKEGILVNCVAPAAVDTPLMSGYQQDLTEEAKAYMVQRIPLGRLGTSAEIARLVGFLASSELTFSTGAVFDASGGRAAF